MTSYDLLSLLVALFGWIFAATVQYSLVRRFRVVEDKMAKVDPPEALKRRVETLAHDLQLRVEKNEAHWDAMYVKFDRLQRSSKQHATRRAASDEAALEEVVPPELTAEEQKMELRKKIHARV